MFRGFRLPILSGLLIGTSYIPFPPWALFFCLAPLWVFIARETSVRRAFWGAWLTQFILNLIGFHWIAYTAVEFGHLPWWVGGFVLLLFAATAHLYYPLSAAVWVALQRRLKLPVLPGLFLLATLFALFENVAPVLFPWHLGYPWLWAGLPGAHSADLIGFEGINFVTILINTLFAGAWLERSAPAPERKRVLRLTSAAVALFAALNLIGLLRKRAWDRFDAEVKVVAVQGNIGNWEKLAAEKGQGFQDEIVRKHLELSRAALKQHTDADALFWPETAFPEFLDTPFHSDPYAMMVRDFVRAARKPLFTGAYSTDEKNGKVYNGFFLMDEQGRLAAPPYRKTILLAFGEYFPGADLLPGIMEYFPNMGSFGRGKGPVVMDWDGRHIGPQICYEGLYPWFSRRLAKDGAEIFMNVTNDSWFGHYFEPRQHLYMTFARALEFRRPLIRATNTGFTTAILANGDILERSPLHEPWTGLFKVPFRTKPGLTPYVYLQPVWPFVLLFLAIALMLFCRKPDRQS